LYVADYSKNTIFTFALAADGSPSGKKTFASVTGPDGMAVDCAGNVYVASNSAGVAQVFSPAGTKLGSVAVAPGMTNLAFGGPERKTLYFTVGRSLYSLPMNLPGLPD
jgi:gluconolactonase